MIYQTPQGSLVGLRPVGETSFDADTTGLAILSFQDPDGINLELTAPLG